MRIGYHISSEEHAPPDLVTNAKRAEQTGFEFLMISDHYHPWIDQQGHSPFVWSVIGGIAQATERVELCTSVTCPTIRIHPAVIAQAAATSACLMPGRFQLGVGAGEALNEHVTGAAWPEPKTRLDMLEEAVEVIRLLWEGGEQSHRGKHYFVDHARVYDVPDVLPPIWMAVGGPEAAELAARIADGFIGTKPDNELMSKFDEAGGAGKPKYGKVTVCWAEDEQKARKIAHKWWPTSAIKGKLGGDLPTPSHFEEAVELVTEDHVAEAVVCGPDAQAHIEAVHEYVKAGYDHLAVHQVGPDQNGFFDFWEKSVLPELKVG